VWALVKTPQLISNIFNSYTWHFKRDLKNIYLTFDDGPIPEVTPWVLDMLKKYNAKATFFCIGDNVLKHPDIFKSIISDNHQIGNHTFNHLKGFSTKTHFYIQNTEKAHALFTKTNKSFSAQKALLFRPPYGKIKPNQIKQLKNKGYKIVFWDVLSRDFDSKLSPYKCLDNVIKYTQNGSIIVFHDSLKAFKNLQYTLPKVLAYYSEKGYSFKAI